VRFGVFGGEHIALVGRKKKVFAMSWLKLGKAGPSK
jgi:hypothetical protein